MNISLGSLLLGALAGVAGALVFPIALKEEPKYSCQQTYPNIPGQLLLENDKVVVQRFTFPPGQWEGVHEHPPNQLYIHLKGGDWKVRFADKTSTGHSPDGSVGWYGPVDMAEDHESVNVGDEPIELIWVTLKETCLDNA